MGRSGLRRRPRKKVEKTKTAKTAPAALTPPPPPPPSPEPTRNRRGRKRVAVEDQEDSEVSFNPSTAPKRLKRNDCEELNSGQQNNLTQEQQDSQNEPLPQELPRKSPNGFILPDPLPRGHVVTDTRGGRWRLGRSIGLGGFGEIYSAAKEFYKAEDYVIKVEPHTNGPLFTEVNFYLRSCRPEQLEQWKKGKRLDHLGVACFLASGSTITPGGKRLRFLVMPRFGSDLQSVLDATVDANKAFSVKTVCSFAVQVVDSLEYIHSKGYIHKDIKGSNILLQHGSNSDRITLVGYTHENTGLEL